MPKLLGALHAAEHALISLLPLWAMCDRWDIGGLSTNLHFQTGLPDGLRLRRPRRAGSGSPSAASTASPAGSRTRRACCAGCPCSSGCPSCVQSPKCGNLNEMLDKRRCARARPARRDARLSCRSVRSSSWSPVDFAPLVRRHRAIVTDEGRRQRGVHGTGLRRPGHLGEPLRGRAVGGVRGLRGGLARRARRPARSSTRASSSRRQPRRACACATARRSSPTGPTPR